MAAMRSLTWPRYRRNHVRQDLIALVSLVPRHVLLSPLVFSRALRPLGGRSIVACGLTVVLGISLVGRGITKTY